LQLKRLNYDGDDGDVSRNDDYAMYRDNMYDDGVNSFDVDDDDEYKRPSSTTSAGGAAANVNRKVKQEDKNSVTIITDEFKETTVSSLGNTFDSLNDHHHHRHELSNISDEQAPAGSSSSSSSLSMDNSAIDWNKTIDSEGEMLARRKPMSEQLIRNKADEYERMAAGARMSQTSG
jgi:hypothetical protein